MAVVVVVFSELQLPVLKSALQSGSGSHTHTDGHAIHALIELPKASAIN